MANLSQMQPEEWPEVRGLVLRYIWRQERKRRSVRFERIWAFVRGDDFKASLDDIQTILEDLRKAGLVQFEKEEETKTGHERISGIATTAKGMNLVECTANDPLVKIGVARDE